MGQRYADSMTLPNVPISCEFTLDQNNLTLTKVRLFGHMDLDYFPADIQREVTHYLSVCTRAYAEDMSRETML